MKEVGWTLSNDSPNVELIRRVNELTVLEMIRRQSPVSKTELVRGTSLTYPTVSKTIDSLTEAGFVRLAGEGKSSGGRPPQLLEFVPDVGKVIGVQIEDSRVGLGLFNLNYDLLEHVWLPLRTKSPAAVESTILEGVNQLDLGNDDRLFGVGIGCPGMVDPATGKVISRAILKWKEPTDITGRIKHELRVPVFIDNDINVATLGELVCGHKQQPDPLIYISVSAGVGAGIVLNGEILKGWRGCAGEIGHLSVNALGPECECGNRGCLEGYVSKKAIAAQLGTGDESEAFRRLKSLVESDSRSAELTYNGLLTYLGTGLCSLINIINPSAITIGGDITDLGPRFLDDLRVRVDEATGNVSFDSRNLLFSSLGDSVGLYGGASVVDQKLFAVPKLMPGY